MPDPNRQSISASQAPALFNVSPYASRWMLWKSFADGMPIESEEDARMAWGKKLEPLILDQAKDDLKLEIIPHSQEYVRRGQLGATRDAMVIAPDLGPGAVEVKCVFDYRIWMNEWSGGKSPPRSHEIQLQQQMLVGDEEHGAYRWGIIAAWVAGELHYFKREPLPVLWEGLQKEAAAFFKSIELQIEPDPFGVPVEIPFLSALDRVEGKSIDLSTGPEADNLATYARLMERANKTKSAAEREQKTYKAKLLAAIGDAEEARLSAGIVVKANTIKRNGYSVAPTQYTNLKIFVPEGGEISAAEDLHNMTRGQFEAAAKEA